LSPNSSDVRAAVGATSIGVHWLWECQPDFAEIDAAEREQRERKSVATMEEWFAEPHPSEPNQHPSVD